MRKYLQLARTFKDFPKPGVNFIDWMPIMQHTESFNVLITDLTYAAFNTLNTTPYTSVIGLESRGFLLGLPVAQKLNLPFIPARKPHKLPGETLSYTYTTEYSTDTLEIQSDAPVGTHPLILDDLAATNGTLLAAQALAKQAGATHVTSLVLFNLPDCPKQPGELDELIALEDIHD